MIVWLGEPIIWKQMEDYALFEQMMREILEGNTGDGATASMVPAATGGTEARIIGIKHW